jgi:type I restriction enzyme S subunit
MTLDHLHGGTSQTTVKHLSAKQVNGIEIPLPPLAEQHRIVAKVDELMALCDQLEAARVSREAARDTFTLSTLAKLNTPDHETFSQDARFALANLAPLTTRTDQIKQLRQTILRLALAGKMTVQDPADDPASKLLTAIDERRSALLKTGYPNATEARTQQRKVAEQSLPKKLSALPNGWEYATLQQCSLMVIDCKNKTAPYTSNGVRLIRTTNVRDGKLNSIDQRYVSPETYEVWSARAKPEPGDILITREAPMGEVCLIPADTTICLGQRMMLARLVPDTISSRFMLYSLMDPDLMDRVQDKPIGMTVQHLRVGGVETLVVPVPPLAEQRRIVAKVDELMALCDGLEASIAIGEQTRSRLLESVLHHSLEPA